MFGYGDEEEEQDDYGEEEGEGVQNRDELDQLDDAKKVGKPKDMFKDWKMEFAEEGLDFGLAGANQDDFGFGAFGFRKKKRGGNDDEEEEDNEVVLAKKQPVVLGKLKFVQAKKFTQRKKDKFTQTNERSVKLIFILEKLQALMRKIKK